MISPYILAIAASWIVAQGLKYAFIAIRHGEVKHFRQLYLSGNMPSAHSASTIALTTVIGLRDHIDSGIFAVSLLFAAIVMYDAVMVRRSSGEQGEALQKLIKEQKSKIPLPRAAKGHTPIEVVCGALLGLAIGIIVFLATK